MAPDTNRKSPASHGSELNSDRHRHVHLQCHRPTPLLVRQLPPQRASHPYPRPPEHAPEHRHVARPLVEHRPGSMAECYPCVRNRNIASLAIVYADLLVRVVGPDRQVEFRRQGVAVYVESSDGDLVERVRGEFGPEHKVEDGGGSEEGDEEEEEEEEGPEEAAAAAGGAAAAAGASAAVGLEEVGVLRGRDAVDLVLGDLYHVHARLGFRLSIEFFWIIRAWLHVVWVDIVGSAGRMHAIRHRGSQRALARSL